MKEFLSLVRKECRHIFRDKRTILIVMIMPIVQIVLFGFAVSTEVTRARIAFCGDMSDARVRSIVERIENNSYLEYAGLLPGPDGIEDLFRRNGADAVVCTAEASLPARASENACEKLTCPLLVSSSSTTSRRDVSRMLSSSVIESMSLTNGSIAPARWLRRAMTADFSASEHSRPPRYSGRQYLPSGLS